MAQSMVINRQHIVLKRLVSFPSLSFCGTSWLTITGFLPLPSTLFPYTSTTRLFSTQLPHYPISPISLHLAPWPLNMTLSYRLMIQSAPFPFLFRSFISKVIKTDIALFTACCLQPKQTVLPMNLRLRPNLTVSHLHLLPSIPLLAVASASQMPQSPETWLALRSTSPHQNLLNTTSLHLTLGQRVLTLIGLSLNHYVFVNRYESWAFATTPRVHNKYAKSEIILVTLAHNKKEVCHPLWSPFWINL